MITLNDVLVNDVNLTTANFARGKGDKDKRKRQIKRSGRWWTPNQVTTATRPGKKNAVLASKKINGVVKYKLLNFGDSTMSDWTKHKDKKRRSNYLSRSGGIRNKSGELTKNDKFSANYWSRKINW